MILHGAGGRTALELRQALGLLEEADHDFIEVLKSVSAMTCVNLKSVYGMFYDNKLAGGDMSDDYLNSTKDMFWTEPTGLDFAKSELARNGINQWIEQQTGHKIKDMIRPDDGSVNPWSKLVLINAIYFKGDWEFRFDKSETKKEHFYVTPDRVVKVDMMFQERVFAIIDPLPGVVALDMPYKGHRLSMILILPTDGSLADLENSLGQVDDLNSFLSFDAGSVTMVKLTLPRFKLESQVTDLSDCLKSLGMKDMFDASKADFSKMAANDVYVSKVLQKAYLEVNEDGGGEDKVKSSEANTNTAAKILNFNRPFMFLVKDNLTGTILISGHVVDPSPPNVWARRLQRLSLRKV